LGELYWRIYGLPIPPPPTINVYVKRILVIGHPGAGKSTLASELGKKIGLPVVHLDKEFWQPGWIRTPEDEWWQQVTSIITSDRWIIDGTFDRTLDLRLKRADTVILLDYSRYLCLWRIMKRVVANFGKVRPNMASGCPDKFDLEFLRWAWNYRRDRFPKIRKSLLSCFADGNLVTFKCPSDAKRFLNEVSSP
jgi:adenylate kinase family enzyme